MASADDTNVSTALANDPTSPTLGASPGSSASRPVSALSTEAQQRTPLEPEGRLVKYNRIRRKRRWDRRPQAQHHASFQDPSQGHSPSAANVTPTTSPEPTSNVVRASAAPHQDKSTTTTASAVDAKTVKEDTAQAHAIAAATPATTALTTTANAKANVFTRGDGCGPSRGSMGRGCGRARLALTLLREKREEVAMGQAMPDSNDSEINGPKGGASSVEPKLLARVRETEAKNAEIAAKAAEIRMKYGEVSERDGVVAHQKEEIRSKDNEIYRLKALVASKDAEIGRKDDHIARMTEVENKLGGEVGAMEGDLARKDDEIARLRKQIERKDGEIARRDGDISNLKSALQNCAKSGESKDGEIARLIAKAVRNDEAFARLKVSKTKLKHDLKDSTEHAANLAADMGRLMTWKDAEIAGKNDEIAQKDEAIGRKDEEIEALKAALDNSRANIDTVDLTNEEEEPPGKRKRAPEPLSVALQRESNQRLARVKQEKVAAEAALEDVRDILRKDDEISQKDEAIGRKDAEIEAPNAALENSRADIDAVDLTNEEEEPPGKRRRATEPLSVALQRESNQILARVKREKVEAEVALEDVRDDLEIANDTVSQQALFTDAWQTKFDEVAEVASAHGVDGSVISGIRNRSVV